jgi:NAD(P)-dependent dehydrogenase (short-subunit alcohol dehydrogenase family)
MNCLMLGNKSDIAMGLQPLLKADGWKVTGWNRKHHRTSIVFQYKRWDLAIVALGTVAPVGLWMDNKTKDWERSVRSNLLLPIRLLRDNWHSHNPGASVCFLAGSNPNMIMRGYSAYNVSKMALLKACEQLDYETPDAKFFALGPGTILTKIHKASAFWHNPKLADAIDHGENRAEKIQRVYDCLKWCISQPKEVIGGRNVCVSDNWENGYLEKYLPRCPDMYKLRRSES